MREEQENNGLKWGTWEELLLASAVNRYGTDSWDFIAGELSERSSDLPSLTGQNCEDKFDELKRRFMSPNDIASEASFVPMVHELKRLRMEFLRIGIIQNEDNIVSLKSYIQELERMSKEEENEEQKRNGDDDRNIPPVIAASNDSGEGENRLIRATATSQINVVVQLEIEVKPKPVGPADGNDPDAIKVESGQDRDVSVYGKLREKTASQKKKKKKTNPVRDDAKASKPISGHVSSASLPTPKRQHSGPSGQIFGGEEPKGDKVSPAKKVVYTGKTRAIARFLAVISSHRLGSMLDRRLRSHSQVSERYKSLIRQHMDLQTIQSKLEKGLYTDAAESFYRDLLLLFINALIFFHKPSPEHTAAQQLRALVSEETRDQLPKQPLIPSPLARIPDVEGWMEERYIKGKQKVNEEKSVCRNTPKAKKKKGGKTQHEYGVNELSSHDSLDLKVDKAKNKKGGKASSLKNTKQSNNNNNNDDETWEEEESKKGEGEKDETKGNALKRDLGTSTRVTRSSKAQGEREKSESARTDEGRPPKRAAALRKRERQW